MAGAVDRRAGALPYLVDSLVEPVAYLKSELERSRSHGRDLYMPTWECVGRWRLRLRQTNHAGRDPEGGRRGVPVGCGNGV